VKTNSALFAPVLLKMKKWKSVLGAIVVVGVLSIPYFLYVPGSISEFTWNFTEGLSVETIAGNQGFAALISDVLLRFGGHWVPTINQFSENIDAMNALVRPALLGWTAIIFGTAVLMTIRTSIEYSTELFLMWILAYFLTYKHIWEHHYVMMLPVFVLLFWRCAARRNALQISPKVFWTVFAVIALPTPFLLIDKARVLVDPEFYWTTAESLAFHTAKPLATLALFIALIVSLWKYGRRTTASEAEPKSSVTVEAV